MKNSNDTVGNCKKHEYFKSVEIKDKKVNRQLPYIATLDTVLSNYGEREQLCM